MFRIFSDIAIQQVVEQAGAIVLHHEFSNLLFFLFLGKFAGKFGTVADILLRLFVFIDQHFQHTHITVDLRFTGFSQQVTDLWLVFLPVAVNTSVTLLEYHQRPRNIEVNHFMAEVVQVNTFRRDIRADEQA